MLMSWFLNDGPHANLAAGQRELRVRVEMSGQTGAGRGLQLEGLTSAYKQAVEVSAFAACVCRLAASSRTASSCHAQVLFSA